MHIGVERGTRFVAQFAKVKRMMRIWSFNIHRLSIGIVWAGDQIED